MSEIEQLRAERDELARDLEAERHHRRAVQESEQRLAAHVAYLREMFNQWNKMEIDDDQLMKWLPIWVACLPETSLARRDAQKQAEALDDMADCVNPDNPCKSLRQEAERLRRQAEAT